MWAIKVYPLTALAWPPPEPPYRPQLYLKEPLPTNEGAHRSRSALARRIVDHVATTLPTRAVRVATDGGYATQAFLRDLPTNVDVVGTFLAHGHTLSTTAACASKASAVRRENARDRLARDLGHAASAGTRIRRKPNMHPILGGDSQRLIRRPLRVVVSVDRTLTARTAPRSKAFGRLQPPEAFFSTEVRWPTHFGDVCRSLGHGN